MTDQQKHGPSEFVREVSESLARAAQNVRTTRFTIASLPLADQYHEEVADYLDTVRGKLSEFAEELKRVGM